MMMLVVYIILSIEPDIFIQKCAISFSARINFHGSNEHLIQNERALMGLFFKDGLAGALLLTVDGCESLFRGGDVPAAAGDFYEELVVGVRHKACQSQAGGGSAATGGEVERRSHT